MYVFKTYYMSIRTRMSKSTKLSLDLLYKIKNISYLQNLNIRLIYKYIYLLFMQLVTSIETYLS